MVSQQRRKAIKKIALTLGITTNVPTLISVLSSCEERKVVKWLPRFFFKEERHFIARLLDIIIPKTDTPSATDMGIHIFVDRYINTIFTEKQQRKLKDGNNAFVNMLLEEAEVGYVNGVDDDEISSLLEKLYNIDIEKEEKYLFDVYKSNKLFPPKEESSRFYFVHELRRLTVLGYITTELISKKVLPYQLSSREQEGCIDISTLATDKSWALDAARLPFPNDDFLIGGL